MPTKEDLTVDYVLEYFSRRCVRCNRMAVTVHEIVPRSKRPRDWWVLDNRIALCADCHDYAHSRGASSSADEMRRLRDAYERSREERII